MPIIMRMSRTAASFSLAKAALTAAGHRSDDLCLAEIRDLNPYKTVKGEAPPLHRREFLWTYFLELGIMCINSENG